MSQIDELLKKKKLPLEVEQDGPDLAEVEGISLKAIRKIHFSNQYGNIEVVSSYPDDTLDVLFDYAVKSFNLGLRNLNDFDKGIL